MNGVCGVCNNTHCANRIREAMFRLQHRGQQYCGISTLSEEKRAVQTTIASGMVLGNLENGNLCHHDGNFGVGATCSGGPMPLNMYLPDGQFSVAFDGFISNENKIRGWLHGNGFGFRSMDQIELIAGTFVDAKDVELGMTRLVESVDGPFAVIALTSTGIYVAKDKHGMKPMVLGHSADGWAAASESCAFYDTGIEVEREIGPGEVVFFDNEQCEVVRESTNGLLRACCFEWIYFARPDSDIYGVNVTEARHNLGRFLAENDNVEVDVMGPVPFSGIMHAEGYHLASGVPSVEIFLPPRYFGRTYIRPYNQRIAEKARKLVPVRANVKGKRVLLVDDSIRAGITMAGIVASLREAGASEVHVRIGSAKSTQDCPHSRPLLEGEQFIGRTKNEQEICEVIGADTLQYQKLEDIPQAIGLPADDLCMDCFL